jgi:ATP-dependent protease ClpP protease subunit
MSRVNLAELNRLAGLLRNRATQFSAGATQPERDPGGRSWYRIEARNAAAPAEVYVYDIIGEWGVSAGEFVNELRGLRGQALDIHINCEGGEIFDGLAIYEALCRHPAAVTAYVDGVAASAASFILQAADERVMAPRSRLMIHDGHGFVYGNAGDMRAMADILDDLSDNIAEIYADRAGGTRKTWRAAMLGEGKSDDGTWYDAAAAVAAGLADRVAEGGRGTGRRDGEQGSEDSMSVRWNRANAEQGQQQPSREQAAPMQDQVSAPAAWDPKAFLSVTTEAAAEPKPPLDLSGLAGLHKIIPNNDERAGA